MLSLCAGAGGLELGLKLALPDCHAVCYVEGEAYASSVLAARMADQTLDPAPVWSDVRTFDSKPWRGCVDIITAGYPCQPFSIAGRKKAEHDPRHLWPYIRDIVADLRPRVAFFENVSHHLRLGFQQVHDDLRGMGYGVKTGLFTAEEVGASHKRERLFILAHAEGAGAWLDQLYARQGFSGNGAALADSARGGNRRETGNLPETPGRPDQQGTRLSDIAGANLADTDVAGLERQPRHERTGHETSVAGESCLPLWPPAPGGTDAWRSVPDAFKPAIHRMADGLADRVDRLRLCGNGVVPLAAAYAFLTLAAFIED
ncbi:MAG: DNA cytosine methyltransferase [Alphaproteobacteria bacterium]|nr:DNA cytosine methyltransferase [Alphaproteobacteria bacterium]